ncbi:MAG: AbrB family transcriptional regulator [Clostridia bacterium]|nr:AbrB family transcriptional regulator [Clostridia bacterium]
MKSIGIVRQLDKVGRVVIPQEIRSQLNMKNGIDSFEIFMDGEYVILKKHQPTCIFCDSLLNTVNYEEHNVCKNCIEKLYQMKDI